MKTCRYFALHLPIIALLLGGAPAYLYAAPADRGLESTSATLLCGGHSRVEVDGTATTQSNWVFRNYDDTGSIQIDRIRIYDRDGASLYDAMPPTASSNGVDPSNVGPHSTIAFHSGSLLGATYPRPNNPLQFVLDWSSATQKRVLTLDGFVVRTNVTGIFTFDCRTIDATKKRGK